MESILKGGTEMIFGGGGGFRVVMMVVASFALLALLIFSAMNPPTSLFGQIALIIGVLIFVSVDLYLCMSSIRYTLS